MRERERERERERKRKRKRKRECCNLINLVAKKKISSQNEKRFFNSAALNYVTCRTMIF